MIPDYGQCQGVLCRRYARLSEMDADPGCRRIIFDNGYLSSLHRLNVNAVWGGIEKIDEHGILDTKGE